MGTQATRLHKAHRSLIWIMLLTPLFFLVLWKLLPPLPSSPMMRDSFWAHKVNSVDKFDIVYTGDSRVYRGVDPETVESVVGLKGFNYGFSSADLDSVLLERAASYLANRGQRILVIGLSANSFLDRSEAEENAHLNSLLRISSVDLWMRENWYPHLTCFDNRAVSDLYKYLKHEHYDETYHLKSGFAASDKTPADTNEAVPLYRAEFKNAKFSTKKLEAFQRYVAQLQKQNITVVFMRMPVTHAMQVLEAEHAPALEAFWHYAKYHDQHTFDGWGDTYTTYDGSHINSASAHEFSRNLGVQLKSILGKDPRGYFHK